MDNDEIKRRMAAKGYRQVDLANLLGFLPNKVSVSLSGKRRFTVEEMDKIRAWLADDVTLEGTPLRLIPIIGQVAAGNWREAVESPEASMPAPDNSISKQAFGLRVTGDSMNLLVEDGGTVIVDPSDKALFPGRYYVVLNGGGETTFKKFAADPARLIPCSSNPEHAEILLGSGEPFTIVGRVIWRASRM